MRVRTGVLESQLLTKISPISQLSAKFSPISQLSVNFDKSQLIFFLQLIFSNFFV